MTTMEIIKPIIDLFKFTPRHFAPFAITSFIIFFIPTNIVKDIAPALYDYYRPVSGLIFILSISGLIVELSIFIANKIRIQFRIQKGKARLNSLTKEEKDILRRYISGDTRTQFFAVDNKVFRWLQPGSFSLFTYPIDSHFWSYRFCRSFSFCSSWSNNRWSVIFFIVKDF